MVDLTAELNKHVTADECRFRRAEVPWPESWLLGRTSGISRLSRQFSLSIVDAVYHGCTGQPGGVTWYDNGGGYACRVIDLAAYRQTILITAARRCGGRLISSFLSDNGGVIVTIKTVKMLTGRANVLYRLI